MNFNGLLTLSELSEKTGRHVEVLLHEDAADAEYFNRMATYREWLWAQIARLRRDRRRSQRERYNKSEKGRTRNIRYDKSDKGLARNRAAVARYSSSSQGQFVRLQRYLRRRIVAGQGRVAT